MPRFPRGRPAPVFAQAFGFSLQVTEDAEEAFRFLREKRGLVIANTYGDRPEDGWIGVFSDSGHYIVLAGIEGNTVRVWDIPGRKGKVRMEGNEAFADVSVIREDCVHRPFFLFGCHQAD